MMRRGGAYIVGLLAAIGQSAAAQSDRPMITTELDTAVIRIGDRIRLTVRVSHGAEQRVAWPDSPDLTPFEVLDRRASEPVSDGDRVTSSLHLTVTAFALGDRELPSFDVVVQGDRADTLATDGWVVTVESVGLDEGGDIRDVKGPVSMPRNWWRLWPWIVGAVMLGLLAAWAYRRWQQRSGQPPPAPVVPELPAHEVALAAFAELERSGLLERGEYKEYHIRASDILRTYFEDRFAIDAMEMVTEEVVDGLTDHGVTPGTVDLTRRFLETCDLVKFAKHTPRPEASRDLTSAARRVVEVTRSVEAPAEASAA